LAEVNIGILHKRQTVITTFVLCRGASAAAVAVIRWGKIEGPDDDTVAAVMCGSGTTALGSVSAA